MTSKQLLLFGNPIFPLSPLKVEGRLFESEITSITHLKTIQIQRFPFIFQVINQYAHFLEGDYQRQLGTLNEK